MEFDEKVGKWVEIATGIPVDQLSVQPGAEARARVPDAVQDPRKRAQDFAGIGASLAADINANLSEGASRPTQRPVKQVLSMIWV